MMEREGIEMPRTGNVTGPIIRRRARIYHDQVSVAAMFREPSRVNQKFGSADVSAVSGGTAGTGQPVILSAAAPSTTEDWQVAFQGTVNDFFNAGLINATESSLPRSLRQRCLIHRCRMSKTFCRNDFGPVSAVR